MIQITFFNDEASPSARVGMLEGARLSTASLANMTKLVVGANSGGRFERDTMLVRVLRM